MPLKFTDDVQGAWNALLDAPSRTVLVDRTNELLDVLENDPGDPRVRRRRFTDPPSWCFTVRGATEDLVVLWSPDSEGDPVVIYIGPSTFT